MNKIHRKLAIYGGQPLRKTPLPYRRLFGKPELKSVTKVFEESWRNKVDFGYQGKYEELYTKRFCEFQGGGYADAVSSGTAAVFIALSALNLPQKSMVLFSPVTDPGGISPAILMGMLPAVADSAPDSFDIGPEEFEKALLPKIKAAVITHVGGVPIDIGPIIEIAKAKGIRIIEDCSQAHGAIYRGKRVGTFGDIAVFSTMFSKNHATGGCGGIVYTRSKDFYRIARVLADRGKPFYEKDSDPKNPGEFILPALNLNQDELSCAIGLSTLAKLKGVISKRLKIIHKINSRLKKCKAVRPIPIPNYAIPSPFFLTVKVDVAKLSVPKIKFAEAIRAEGIWVNPDYRYVVSEWGWIKKYCPKGMRTPNASKFRDESFNILLNERFSDKDIDDIIACILKVESYLLR